MKQRWALVLLGMWLSGSLVVAVVAAQNFFTIDRLLLESQNPEFQAAVARLGRPAARDLLRYLSAELNRLYFQLWNAAQVVVGAIVLALLARRPSAARARFAAAAMFASVLVMTLWLTPEIISLGRTLDFVPREPIPAGLRRFGRLHASYLLLELAKLFVGILTTVWIAHSDTVVSSPAPTE
jgi:hypothetical protein